MRHTSRLIVAVLGMALAASAATAGDLVQPIDLSSFGEIGPSFDTTAARSPDGSVPIVPVDSDGGMLANRIYVSGIVGASFATLSTGGSNQIGGTTLRQSGSVNETIFTGGGALGIAFAKPSGLLRMEVEGRARGPMTGQTSLITEEGSLPLDVTVTNGWSTLTNFWRDFFVTDALGIYVGGGFGVGGYQYAMTASNDVPLSSFSNVTTFAWQAGTGFVYAINDRITIDTGYRFFAMTPDSAPLLVDAPLGAALSFGQYTSAFSASELLLSVRIYEPFRNWR